MSSAPEASVVEPSRSNQREHILDNALTLMAEQGAGSTSMRQLARACGVNVAALYHYFPSKADLLRSVIEERQYALRLRTLPEIDAHLPPRERLTALILSMWYSAVEEEAIWRLLWGEGLRGDETALQVGGELLDVIEPALLTWLSELFPNEDDTPIVDLDALALVILSQLSSFFIGHLFRPPSERDHRAHRQAEAIAALAFPPS